MRRHLVLLSLLALSLASRGAVAQDAQDAPPPIDREFRAIWLATVGNIDWPSKPGLSTWDQQRELLTILDRAVALKMNAVVFQIRPSADALYNSPYEPWSEFLTGRQGRAPEPIWDPLAFAVEEAHKRGLELHAWFNPYRAAYSRDTMQASSHVSRTNPELVWRYDNFLWMDPGDAVVRRRSLRAVVDVVKRYDVDAVHIDDYFYPYPTTDRAGKKIDFPDSATYMRYRRGGGTLSKDDWRRNNVDLFVEAMYKQVHATKSWVQVGISPFGIWRPGNPPQIQGFDAYQEIYANSKKWLQNGWADYLAPQLYWPIAQTAQSFPVLYDWWNSVNTKGRHIWPGLATYRIAEKSARTINTAEILAEIDTTRARGKDLGHIHFNTSVIMNDADSVSEKLGAEYASPAIPPASPWLGAKKPMRPTVKFVRDRETHEPTVTLAPAANDHVWLWTVRSLIGGAWSSEVLPGATRAHRLSAMPARVVVTAVSRTGVESEAVSIVP
ncbi:MAG TPA: family 10 glycosylhydrolase [Gemmatimonadaceae bacterium]|jgi:uncharacterized lipoprotein YddW (UPF0748 family)